jgi:hypothetical protein
MVFDNLKTWFAGAWKWIEALWDKHDKALGDMVQAVLPMVIAVAFRSELSGEQKKKAIVDAILDSAGQYANGVSKSMLNEAIEIAANKYNIQIGKLTIDKIDMSRTAVLAAGREFANGQLQIKGTEAEDAGVKVEVPVQPQ